MIDKALSKLTAGSSTQDRQQILQLLVEYWHGQIAPEDSIPERILTQYSLPEPLRWWYKWAGNRASIMSGQNFLLNPDELKYRNEAENQKLVFYVENQGVYQWSTLIEGKDPPVYGRFNDDEAWQAEGILLSEHLLNVCLFEAIFCHSPFGASASYVPEDTLQKLIKEIPPIAIKGWRWTGGMGFFVKNGIFMHVAKYEASGETCHSVWIGAKSREPLAVLRPIIDDTWESVEF